MRRLLCGAVVLLALAWVVPASADTPRPSAAVDGPGVLNPGAHFSVVGSHWPERTVVLVELCGNSGASTTDCDRPRSRTLGVGTEGTFTAPITASVPPSPCPCVVRVTSMSSAARFAVPVEVVGAPVAQVTDPVATGPSSSLQIDAIHLERTSTFGEWFGRPPERELTFQVTNTSSEVLHDLPVEVLVGSDPEAGRQIDVEPIESLEPGATTTVAATVGFDPLTIGRAELFGSVGRDSWQAMFEADTHSFPWGLLLVVLLALQVGLVLSRNAVRRHLHPELATASPLAALPVGSGVGGAVIDLRDGANPAPTWVPVAAPLAVALPGEGEPNRTLTTLLEIVDGIRATSSAPAGTTAVVVVAAASGPGGGTEVAVRAAPFTPAVADDPWVAPGGLESGTLVGGPGVLSPSIIDAISGGRPIALDVDDETERSLASLGGRISAELLAFPSVVPGRDVAAAVALSAEAGDVTHVVVVELPAGTGDEPMVVLRSVHTT
ncbi:MAG TPA: hypothetical protein VIY72_04290 [Acidimicrobiales bacterium]